MKRASQVLAAVLPILIFPTVAAAQATVGDSVTPGAGAGATAPMNTPGSPMIVVNQAPAAAPTGPVGGGNANGSSSRPISGPNDRDGFDIKTGGGGGTVRGGEGGVTFQGSPSLGPTNTPLTHTVRRGDTLSGISDYYFRNPYHWPKLWALNPDIKNPHWIYPGDNIRLKKGAAMLGSEASINVGGVGGGSRFVDRRRQVGPETVFLRNEGYVEDENDVTWGDINGSPQDKLFLTEYDEVYVRVLGDRDVKLGQELTIFRPVAGGNGKGRLIEIQGTLRVDQWNAKERIARARIVEVLDTIERGARVGPIGRTFEVVSPTRNDADVAGKIIANVHAQSLFVAHQVVFVDIGSKEGVKAGNRLQIRRQGDGWDRSLVSGRGGRLRIAIEQQSTAAVEYIPTPREADALPEELDAELRVVTVRDHSAMCVVTTARREIEPGDPVFLRKGY